jgi:hypothetical protein
VLCCAAVGSQSLNTRLCGDAFMRHLIVSRITPDEYPPGTVPLAWTSPSTKNGWRITICKSGAQAFSRRGPHQVCFTICWCISPDLHGYRAPKMKQWRSRCLFSISTILCCVNIPLVGCCTGYTDSTTPSYFLVQTVPFALPAPFLLRGRRRRAIEIIAPFGSTSSS